jgi:hypothetical protein
MDRKKLFLRMGFVVIFIFLLNLIGHKFYWYYSVWYYDIIMHTFGGLWVGLAIFWLFFNKFKSETTKNIILVLLGVLIVGVCWEFFEILVNETIAKNPFNFLDTVSDIFCDLTGGAVAAVYFYNRIVRKEENKL